MLASFGSAIYRSRIAVLVVGLLIVAITAVYGLGVFGTLKSGGFTVPNSDSDQVSTTLAHQLNASSSDVVLLLRSPQAQATDPAVKDAATQLFTTLKARPEVAAVTSYYSTQSPSFLSHDGHATFAVLRLSDPAGDHTKQQEYDAIAPLLAQAPAPLQVSAGGAIVVNEQVNQQVGQDLARAESLTLPIVFVLLVIVFNGLVAALLPLLTGGVAIFGAFAIVRGLATFTDFSIFVTNVMTFMGLGLAIDYALFIITRFRAELAPDEHDVQGALRRTMATAGRTVLFSGLTVSISLLGLLFFPEFFLRSMGLAASAAVFAAMVAALTILPAVLALLGRRVNALSFSGLLRRAQPARKPEVTQGTWYRLAQNVMRFPVPIMVVGVAILLLFGSPFLHVSFSNPDYRVLPANTSARVVSEALTNDFPQQGAAQLTLVVRSSGSALSAANLASLDAYVRQLRSLAGVSGVESLVSVSDQLPLSVYQQAYGTPGANPQLDGVAQRLANGNLSLVTVHITSADFSPAARSLVTQVRAVQPSGSLTVLVGGATPELVDLLANLGALLPLAGLTIAVATFVLLFLMTGSFVVPLKALVINTLSLTATFGALVWGFQDGHLQSLLGFTSTGSLDASQPVLIFAIAFGLSMDYEVFLLSQIKERFDATGDNRLAVVQGLARSGGLITSAAVLLAVVIGAFALSKIIFIQEIGVGVALAVVMDATLVRGFLVPATMRLLGNANWWAPRPLQRLATRSGLAEAH